MILQNVRFLPEIPAPPSKSEAIRALILSALCSSPTDILLASSCKDIDVCAQALRALGAKAERTDRGYRVTPRAYDASDIFRPDFGDCAAALRLLAPVYRARTGKELSYTASARLSARVAAAGGLYGTQNEDGSITVHTDISSQTASGELLALALRGGTLRISGNAVSRPYLHLTETMLQEFSGCVETTAEDCIKVQPSALTCPQDTFSVSGDYSSTAYLLTAGCIGRGDVTVRNLSLRFPQGDAAVTELLRRMGGNIELQGSDITAHPSALHSAIFDAADVPDLVPPLCAAACAGPAPTTFLRVERLRYKESDRVSEIISAVRSLGGYADYADGSLTVHGPLRGGKLPHTEDHRIAMMGVLLSLLTEEPVETDSLGCVVKSYPDFCNTFRRCP